MIRKYFLIIPILILSASLSNAQYKDSLEAYFYKLLTPEQSEAIFGPITGVKLNKVAGDKREIKDITIKGNKITTILFNYGSVCAPSVLANVQDLVWNGLGYGFEFGLLAGAEVIDVNGDTLHIVSDSHVRTTEGDYSPDGTLKWGWLPRPGYSDPNQNKIASLLAEDKNGDGKPDSWPEQWYSAVAGKYLWPAFLGDMATAPDEEVYYGIDDFTNYEFIDRYQPFPSDPTKGGLGLEVTVRILQFNNPMAEDIIFMVYQVTNASEKDLNKVYFGMYGDPHVGGATDYNDDRAFFIPPIIPPNFPSFDQRARSMVYAWDEDFQGMGGKVPGYFGWKFLESPSFDDDGIDNDDDGIIDESPFNDKGFYIDGVATPLTYGIYDVQKYTKVYGAPKPRWSGDEDGDWDPEKDDVGIDGIGPESPNYPGPDYGEGDGVPSQAWYLDLNNNGVFDKEEESTLSDIRLPGYKWAGSEPNFGYRDISESDMIGLTGFTAGRYNDSNFPKEDELMWQWFTKPYIDPEQPLLKTAGDNIFCFSTGPMSLKRGETQRFSMAIIMGENLNDLLLNAITSVRILEADYRFAQPPAKPIVQAVAEDGKVRLYWDAKSEDSIDPLTREKDFEGYKIYRSRDYNFSDVYTITDANGVPFLGQALVDPNTGKRAQFDLINEYSGLAEREYDGRGVKYYLGDNTGLKHEYVDSTVQNGVTYYYAVVAYDHGSPDLPPTETQSVIQRDPLTGELIFDVNTVQVIPGPVSIGITDPEVGLDGSPTSINSDATGKINIKVLDKLAVKDNIYKINFDAAKIYNVLDSTGIQTTFVSKDTILVKLPHNNILPGSLQLIDESNNVIDTSQYIVNYVSGQIAGRRPGYLPAGNLFNVYYRYYPVYKSKLLNNEDGNQAFDGLRVFIKNDSLHFDPENTKFIHNSTVTVLDTIFYPALIGPTNLRTKISADWEIRWNDTDTLADGSWKYADTINTLLGKFACPFKIFNLTANEPATFVIDEIVPGRRNNKRWDWGEGIVLQPQGATNAATSYEVILKLDKSKSVQVLPKNGDIFQIKTKKPFEAGDLFVFETKKAMENKELQKQALNDIYVVPNPYVAYSISENPGSTLTKRGEREIQFRNLPPQCTIRIYTITGELVDTIHKDDLTSMASWNLLSSEGMKIAYGVYLFHVEIPGVGEKIGRFAVIK
ncbi:MAG: hypothetical protein B6D44_04400 [Ignavibacteriales bacterium UTCHB2]|jgi:hypothetical protein|nr:MAG: hypothetical protein BWY38_01446 [Ignavibacteria bacterium ADurb.Bin266]OQY74373.1 MAG: hypothetical protein B6D44_04400 [Ignavibacteriales bacterium UTCHB2]